MSHTPGPWKLVFDVDGAPGFIWGKTTCICDFGKDVPKPEDARLIAAAPELCEALEHVQAIISQSTGVAGWHLNGEIAGWDELGLREEIDAALAKARGDEGEDNA